MEDCRFPNVSIVVIGHNEAENLGLCFEAINRMHYPRKKIEVIYVDSNSDDNSVEIASRYTNNIVNERSLWATAGLARNMGILHATYDYIHFIDGDIQINPQYLLSAITFLEEHPEISAVTGFYTEHNNTFWNKLISYRRLEDGGRGASFTNNTSGGGTYRKKDLLDVDGYDERIKKGQEAELGYRMKELGYKIWFLNISQGIHNFGINSFGRLVARFLINGRSNAYMMLLYLKEKQNRYLRSFMISGLKNYVKYGLLTIFVLLCLVLHLYKTTVGVVVLYNLYIVVSIVWKNRKLPFHYSKYRLTMAFCSYITFVGMNVFFISYAILKLRGIELIKKKQGLHGKY